MGSSQLSKKCQKCPLVEECDHKKMEAMAYLSEPQVTIGTDTAQPLLRETTTIHIKGRPVPIYKDEIGKQLYAHLYSHLGLQYGG